MSTKNFHVNAGLLAYLIMLATPLAFSTNVVFGRFVAGDTDPFVLAWLRWTLVAAILLPVALLRNSALFIKVLRENIWLLVATAILGMGFSGSGVYLGLSMTTATNATLIYSTSPIIIILFERLFFSRKITSREIIGAALAFIGVAVIVLRGDLSAITHMKINPGDGLILLASFSWAGYSLLYRSKNFSVLDNRSLFALIAIFGSLVNLPLALPHIISGEGFPANHQAWYATGGIVFVSSLAAFSGFQYGIRALGASVAGLFMFLMTPYGVLLAVQFLGETLQSFHKIGIVLVMGGVIFATLPKSIWAKFATRKP